MGGSSFTFRCGECNRLLGVSRSRIGSTVTCPKCGIELVVPDPDGEASPPDAGTESATVPESGESATVEATAAGGASVFSGLAIESEPLSLRPREPSRPYRVPDRRPVPTGEPGGSGSGFAGVHLEASPIREATVASGSEPRTGIRAGDVVLPRTAFLLWSFVMLVALVAAFASGLLAGHFLWPQPRALPSTAAPAAVTTRPIAR